MATIQNSLAFAQELIRQVLLPGEQAIDATAGNGHDTVFLARLVGSKGKIWAFDIQVEAIKTRKNVWKKENLRQRVNLLLQGHENMAVYIKKPVGAIMFNLGYLPGGDHSIITARHYYFGRKVWFKAAAPGGIMTIVMYTGHTDGGTEAAQLKRFCHTLNQKDYHVLSYCFLNQQNHPPQLLAIEKR